MRIIFMGTPDFAATALGALIADGHEIVAVYTQPPRPAGRGQEPRKTAVHKLAEKHGLRVLTPASLKDAGEQGAFRGLGADVAVVAAYGLLLPAAILGSPRLGCLNIHASLLPRWRGAAPIQRAILAGDDRTGVSIMQMDEGLDTGAVLRMESMPIGPTETAGELHDRLADLGARMIVETLRAGPSAATPQAREGVAYAAKVTKAEKRLDWSRDARRLERQVRAFAPDAWCQMPGGRILKVLKAAAAADAPASVPGTLLDDRLLVACGSGALRLIEVKKEGGRAMPAADFLRGQQLAKGDRMS